MFMNLKHSGELKTIGIANGSLQRICSENNESSSTSPCFCSFKHICAMIAKELRDVVTIDLLGLFLQTDRKGEDTMTLRLTGMVELLLVEFDSKRWRKNLRSENGKHVLHVACDKVTHGTLNAALLRHKKLANAFGGWKLIMNPYDPCVWNLLVGNKQLTIMFHIDDLMMSHVDPEIVTEHVKKLDGVHGNKHPLSITRGKMHEYLGITIEFGLKRGVSISQYDFMKKLWASLS